MNKKERLINLLERLNNQDFDRRKIEIKLNKSKGYLDRAVSTGVISDKALTSLEDLYNEITTKDYDIGSAIRKIEATNEVMLSAIGELLARDSNMTVTTVQKQLETLVNERLKSLES